MVVRIVSIKIFGRANAGFYCWEAVQAYEKGQASFIIVARKTTRLLAETAKAPAGSPRRASMPMSSVSSAILFFYQVSRVTLYQTLALSQQLHIGQEVKNW